MKIRRTLSALIALIAWTGLGVQFDATSAAMESIVATIWIMLLYFTIIANLAAAVVFTGFAAGNAKIASPFVLGGVTIAMMLVGIVYNTLLHGMVELSGGAKLADFLNHRITPILVAAFWLLLADKGHLGWRAPLKWALLPLAYFAYALVRGAAEGRYPYPFMNLQKLGWEQTLLNATAMAICFVIVGYAMVWLDRRSLSLDDGATARAAEP